MKLMHTTKYYIFNETVKIPFLVSIISDLHFSYTITNKKLEMIRKHLEKLNPKYILLPGDLIDSIDMIISKE